MGPFAEEKIETWGPSGPWVLPLENADPQACFEKMSARQHCLFFDSAMKHPELGRYSFLMADPVQWICSRDAKVDDWSNVCRLVDDFQLPIEKEDREKLPPFLGGAAGLVNYDWAAAVENVPRPKRDDFQTPVFAFGVFDIIIAWDHVQNHSWIISSGCPEGMSKKRESKAISRIKDLFHYLLSDPKKGVAQNSEPQFDGRSESEGCLVDLKHYFRLDQKRVGKHFPDSPISMDSSQTVLTGTSLPDYLASIERAKDYLACGDIFQVNLAQQLMVQSESRPEEIYQKLRIQNPAPFSAYLDLGESVVLSASPERLFSLRSDGLVETRPIKGTCPRTGDQEKDREAGARLRSSPKDCAENVMIVDLLRNDLSRVCCPDSVQVESLCQLEPYQFVQHLTSVVKGRLESGKSVEDILLAVFPGGSITGAPKVRAMEIIQELEPVARGAYCGSMGFVSFGQSDEVCPADFSILIRTMTYKDGWVQLPVGGGIVLDSDPKSEFDETLVKAHGMLKALL